jgi:hypothetical protein
MHPGVYYGVCKIAGFESANWLAVYYNRGSISCSHKGRGLATNIEACLIWYGLKLAKFRLGVFVTILNSCATSQGNYDEG